MEPALDVIGRALNGDEGARAFLERTSSIYVLDVTDNSNPKTYGCWNFIHQALNEIERYESKLLAMLQQPKNASPAATATTAAATTTPTTTPPPDAVRDALVHHVRLLASMALRVARRPPQGDRAIVATCISNASDYHCSPSQSQWLFDLNLELREIVMGRIAAMAFDFSFHRSQSGITSSNGVSSTINHGSSNNNNNGVNNTKSGGPQSVFADHVVMDTFNAILAANAVSTGPSAVRHFATEWIIPSSRNIPVSALISIAHHLALEGMRPASPAGTMDMLQQLSIPISSMVLVPAMADAATDNSNEDEMSSGSGRDSHAGNSRILAKALAALNVWCTATTLTLPQLKHISSKIHLDIVDVLNDAMYSDSSKVVDALADFIEHAMESTFEETVSDDRMNQVRHIINVNESAFRASFSRDQLMVIEQKEMAAILEQLVSAVGLQRIRFLERQNQGDVEVCRNLAAWARRSPPLGLDYSKKSQAAGEPLLQHVPERGLLEFLLKAAHHPSVHICGMTLNVIPSFVSNKNLLARELIPLLQRKAIMPHGINSETGDLTLVLDQYGSGVDEFLRFRQTVVADALRTCWEYEPEAYIDSCTSAIEEFCTAGTKAETTHNLSFHLEAALFCVESLGSFLDSEEARSSFAYSDQFSRSMAAVSQNTISITSNPLTVMRLALLLQRWTFWFHKSQKLGVVVDLAASTLTYALQLGELPYAQGLVEETNSNPTKEACIAFEELISVSIDHFTATDKLSALLALWESVYSQRMDGRQVPVESIEPLGRGVCSVILRTPENVQKDAFCSLLACTKQSVDHLMVLIRDEADSGKGRSLLPLMGGELRLLAAIVKCSTTSHVGTVDMMDEDETSPVRTGLSPHLAPVIQQFWPSIEVLASNYCSNRDISSSMGALLSALIPITLQNEDAMAYLRGISSVVSSMLAASPTDDVEVFDEASQFLKEWIVIHGKDVEKTASSGMTVDSSCEEMVQTFQKALVELIAKAEPCLNSSLVDLQVQGQGEAAFESRPPPSREAEHSSFNCLRALLDLLQTMGRLCPIYLMNVKVGSEHLIRRVAGSSVVGLSASDTSLARTSMLFLTTLCELSTHDNEAVQKAMIDNLTQIRKGVVTRLLMGFCGKFVSTLLSPASQLLHTLASKMALRLDFETDMVAILKQEYFLLGDDAKNLTLSVFRGCAQGTISATELETFLCQVWKIHRTDDFSLLPSSDAVARLLQRFSLET
eukprot:CAMPEP_0168754312 /NCGR_PEP_ID=MMETSP0724-20121128/19433_1 /TAXON_ID=265536 /ORGANISM="Amphiprora sp., Strain CCMP467" /LENGTH=1227 /DNA_ID=CAMNT_0008802781 /DNA_START=397 /DNA_END=4081 /DNA_ORIENTATION=-